MSTANVEHRLLNEVESRELLKKHAVHQNDFQFCRTKEEAVAAASRMGFPLVLKIVSPKIVHKSDFGGVKVGLNSVEDVANAYDEVVANAGKRGVAVEEIEGVTVQEMVSGVEELLIGAKRDPIFGTIIVVGLGGVFVELMKDVSIGISPLSEQDIERMVMKLKGYPLLDGFRGRDRADVQRFMQMIKQVENMVEKEEGIQELDLNPVIVKKSGEGCVAVDARIVMKEE